VLSSVRGLANQIDKLCRSEGPLYGAGWDMTFERPEPRSFEMNVGRCFAGYTDKLNQRFVDRPQAGS
jgi:hypothetical protein